MKLSKELHWIQKTFRWWCQFALQEDLKDCHQNGHYCSTCILLTAGTAAFWFCKTSWNFISAWFVYTDLMHAFKCFRSIYEDHWKKQFAWIPYVWCCMRLTSCVVDSVTQIYVWYFRKHTYNLWDKKSSKLSVSIVLRLWLFLFSFLYFPLFINNDMLTDLTFYDAQTLYMYETDLTKPRRLFSLFLQCIDYLQSLVPYLFFCKKIIYLARDQRCL